MKTLFPARTGILFAVLLSLGASISTRADDTSSKDGADQTDNNYYWQGTQLYNLGRLGEAFDSFEKAIQRKQNAKEAEAYLLQIRQEIVNNAKKKAQERSSTLNFANGSPDNALNITYVQKGYVRIKLQENFLFDENTAFLKTTSVEVLNRLADIFQNKDVYRVELIVDDELDSTPNAKDVDAERSLLVFSYVNFKKLSGDNQAG